VDRAGAEEEDRRVVDRVDRQVALQEELVEMRDAIYEEIDRGVTKLPATGGYTDAEKPIIMVVVHQTEFSRLKQLVKTVDPAAFVIVSDAAEVLGEGFKRA
jgi:uncharacterized membrane-anchored protein YitT (DUF2179 family)